MKTVSTYRVYYEINDERYDDYIQATSPKQAIEILLSAAKNYRIIEVSKVLKNW